MTYQLKVNNPTETPDDQKVIVETTTVTQKREFTLGEKKREIERIDLQINDLEARKLEIENEMEVSATSLHLTIK